MKFFKFEYEDQSLIAKHELESIAKTLVPEIERVSNALHKGYDTEYGSINLPFDYEALLNVKEYIKKKGEINPSALVLIGIGGSNLGTIALHEALHGPYFNELNPSIKLYTADTVDAQKINDSVHLISQELDRGNQVLINVITKSGTTTETILNFSTFLNLLKSKRPADYTKYVVVTTDAGSPLESCARREQFDVLHIPHKVGGRFSVFSSVGLFPLGLLGFDLEQLLEGARSAITMCVSKDIGHNPAALNATLKYAHYKQGRDIHTLFVFSTFLESVGKWYRQLMGESIGKEYNLKGERVEIGITPTVSVGTTDLHSVGQLYLGGPRNMFTTFISIERDYYTLSPSLLAQLGVEFVTGSVEKTITAPIMNAILQGVKIAYKKNKRPYCSITLPEMSPYYLGQLLQMYMIEIMYLGYLLGVNPFDQPNVELYKTEANIQLKDLLI